MIEKGYLFCVCLFLLFYDDIFFDLFVELEDIWESLLFVGNLVYGFVWGYYYGYFKIILLGLYVFLYII